MSLNLNQYKRIILFILSVLCTITSIHAQDGHIALNQWIDRDDSTAIYYMHFITGSSCIPIQEKLKIEIKKEVVLVNDYQSRICTDDVAERYIHVTINKKQYPNYKTMKVVYLYNADEMEYDFETQQLVAIKPEVLGKSFQYLFSNRSIDNCKEESYIVYRFFSKDSVSIEKCIKQNCTLSQNNKSKTYTLKKYAYKFTDNKKIQISGFPEFVTYRIYKNRLVATKVNKAKIIETEINEIEYKDWIMVR